MSNIRRWEAVLLAVSLIPLARLAYVLVLRIVFPWDLFIWSESPFMTNMLKVSAGHSVYGPPSDANSFVYSPGLEYLTYAILRPFRLQLDVRACRVVIVAIGLGACALAAAAGRVLALRLAVSPARYRGYVPLILIVNALILFRSFTADVCHPDNLYALHVTATFLLCLLAVVRDDYRMAITAVTFAALGVLAKQTAALAFLGATAALILLRGRRWGFARCMLLIAAALGAFLAALMIVFGPQHGRFYTLDLLMAQGVVPAKLLYLWNVDVLRTPSRLILLVTSPLAAAHLGRSDAGRAYTILWLLIGATAVVPTLSAYMKAMGLWNNLVVIDLWLSLIVMPVLYQFLVEGDARRRAGAWIALALLVAALFPTKQAPVAGDYAYGTDLESHVGADVRAGKRVLLAHATMPLVRSGLEQPPLDRANSVLELSVGGRETLAGTAARIAARQYDVIYLNSIWYGPLVNSVINMNYHEVGRLPGNFARGAPFPSFEAGFQGLMSEVRIMVPNLSARGSLSPARP